MPLKNGCNSSANSFLGGTVRTAAICLCTITAVAACSPTVRIEAPDKPIHFKVDLNIKQEIQVRVENDLEQVSVSPAIPVAKKSGYIGERPDGYLAVVSHRVDEKNMGRFKSMVDRVNDERFARFEEIAKKHGIDRKKVEAMAGRKFIDNSEPGSYVMTKDEKWTKKDS